LAVANQMIELIPYDRVTQFWPADAAAAHFLPR
jgi:hypothetical protein